MGELETVSSPRLLSTRQNSSRTVSSTLATPTSQVLDSSWYRRESTRGSSTWRGKSSTILHPVLCWTTQLRREIGTTFSSSPSMLARVPCPHTLHGCPRQYGPSRGCRAEDQLQADPHVLQLARYSQGPCPLPVRTQASLPGG